MSRNTVQPAKLTPPLLPPILERPRVYRALDRARNRPIAWLGAPPGAGKTTLVAAYARARKLRPIWYQADAADADPATLFHFLGLAVAGVSKRRGPPLPHLTPEYLPGRAVFARRFFEELGARVPPRALLVFDNYNEIAADAEVHDLLAAGLDGVPRGLGVWFVSRSGPPAAFARLRAGRRIAVVEPSLLDLSERESAGLVRLLARGQRRRLAAPARKALYEASGGWAAGLVLLLEHDASVATPVGSAAGASALFDYLEREIVRRLEPRIEGFLERTAVLPAMTAEMAAALTGESSAAEILERLHLGRYLTLRYDAEPPLYRYHPLLREFLLARATQRHDAGTLVEWRAAAARALERAGRIEEAADLYHESGAVPELARLIVTHAAALLGQGRVQVVERWIERLPTALCDETPWLLFWHGAARAALDPLAARRLLERAHKKFAAQRDDGGTLLSWAAIVDAIWFGWNELEQVDEWIDRYAQLAASGVEAPAPEIDAAVVCAMFNALSWRRPQPELIEPWAAKAERLLEHAPFFGAQQAITAASLVYHHVELGAVERAERLLAVIDRALERGLSSPILEVARWQIEAVVLSVAGEPERALEAVEKGFALVRAHGVLPWNVPLLGVGALAALSMGDLRRAEGYVEGMLEQSRGGQLRSWALSLQCGVALSAGRVREARSAAEAAVALASREGLFQEGLCRLALAEALHAAGRRRQAAVHAARGRSIARLMGGGGMLEIGSRLTAAELAFAAGKEDRGTAELRAGFGVAAAAGLVEWQSRMRRADLAELCARALDAGIEPDHVRKVIVKRRLQPGAAALGGSGWPWPVKVYTLGRFALLRDGQPVTFSGKTQRRPLELLKLLVALGGRGVSETRVAEILWPSAEADAAEHALTMTLKRLRALLGAEGAVVLSDRKLTLNPHVCWVDVWAFERGLADAAGDVERTTAALALYHGAFLGDDEAGWALSLRERLRAKYLSRVSALGRKLEARQDWSTAIDWYRCGLEVDDLAEELYQRLMTCYERIGRVGDALSAYARCERMLAASLGVQPSARTRAIRQSLHAAP